VRKNTRRLQLRPFFWEFWAWSLGDCNSRCQFQALLSRQLDGVFSRVERVRNLPRALSLFRVSTNNRRFSLLTGLYVPVLYQASRTFSLTDATSTGWARLRVAVPAGKGRER